MRLPVRRHGKHQLLAKHEPDLDGALALGLSTGLFNCTARKVLDTRAIPWSRILWNAFVIKRPSGIALNSTLDFPETKCHTHTVFS